MVAAGALGGWLALAADGQYLSRANATLAVLAMLSVTAGVASRLALAIPVAVALLGAEYVTLLGFEGAELDNRAPLVAAGLLAVAELGYWSLELRGGVDDEPGTYLRRVALLAGVLLGAATFGVVLLAVVAAVESEGPVLDALGAVAAVGALTLLALAARRTG